MSGSFIQSYQERRFKPLESTFFAFDEGPSDDPVSQILWRHRRSVSSPPVCDATVGIEGWSYEERHRCKYFPKKKKVTFDPDSESIANSSELVCPDTDDDASCVRNIQDEVHTEPWGQVSAKTKQSTKGWKSDCHFSSCPQWSPPKHTCDKTWDFVAADTGKTDWSREQQRWPRYQEDARQLSFADFPGSHCSMSPSQVQSLSQVQSPPQVQSLSQEGLSHLQTSCGMQHWNSISPTSHPDVGPCGFLFPAPIATPMFYQQRSGSFTSPQSLQSNDITGMTTMLAMGQVDSEPLPSLPDRKCSWNETTDDRDIQQSRRFRHQSDESLHVDACLSTAIIPSLPPAGVTTPGTSEGISTVVQPRKAARDRVSSLVDVKDVVTPPSHQRKRRDDTSIGRGFAFTASVEVGRIALARATAFAHGNESSVAASGRAAAVARGKASPAAASSVA